ncbi:heavy metal translocating P-type ATPase [Agaribacter flavus]|uniref:Heavy metal translocating P-type ATPase n=1 Tax=Agaribacter flavus TaxID=1902781 RepID=A0ABV7FN35_9ALTE
MSIIVPENACYHCGLPNTEGNKYLVKIKQVDYPMCCPGCYAVASAIVDNGLESYYEFRTELAERGDAALDATMAKLAVYDEPELQEEFVFDQGKHKQIQLTIEGISCAACAWLIEKQLAKLSGIKQIAVNVAARRAMVTWDDKIVQLSGVLKRLKQIGYDGLPFQPDDHEASYKKEQKSYLKKLGLAGIMTMQVMMLAFGQYFDVFGNLEADTIGYFNAVSLLLTTPVVLYSGSVFYLSAIKAFQAYTVNMDVPISVAILATYIAGLLAVNSEGGEVYFESICMFVFFLLVSRFLEHRSRHKAAELSSNMLKLIPVTASKWQEGAWHSVLAKQLRVDDKVMVKAGESIPIDGTIVEGQTTINESMLTGEFAPVLKTVGDPVYAGTINQEGTISLAVSKSIKYAVMNQILRLQEVALSSKPKVAQIADQFSRYFVLAVLLISGLSYAYWHHQGNPDAFWITISILVATCPCALGLATPSALTCAMAHLNKKGILLKRADALEQITLASDIVFDKTGTLTLGEFSIQKMHVNQAQITSCQLFKALYAGKLKTLEDQKQAVLNVAANIEQYSEHPIAKAFSLEQTLSLNVSAVNIVIGKGISAQIDGFECHIGSKALIAEVLVKNSSRSNTQLDTNFTLSDANVYMLVDGVLIAEFCLSDTHQPEAAQLIKQLSQYKLSILSGDEQANVEKVADELGVKYAYGNNTPEQKLQFVKDAQAAGRSLIMLGDGINDAPVLAAADVSVAVGKASDLAKNAADLVLLGFRLNALHDLLNMAKRTKAKIKQNIGWALTYNFIVLPFAISGMLSPWQAALGMSVSSIIVVYNSTRLMK